MNEKVLESTRRVALVVGTRPEAIKLAPVVRCLGETPGFDPLLISTGQHSDLLDMTFASLKVAPDIQLRIMTDDQTLNQVCSRILAKLPETLGRVDPRTVLVQGDTSTAFASALAAYHMGIPVGHVEAGLRTHDHGNPFPEEANRQLVDRIATWCFAPTARAADNLHAEGIDSSAVFVVGNTAIDSLLWMIEETGTKVRLGKTLLITLHRRESFGKPLREILAGIRDFLEQEPTASALWPLHPNPSVGAVAQDVVADTERLALVPPMDYASFTAALGTSRLVLTDSGGIQEEAPSLGKRVLIARDETERPEGIEAGCNVLVGRTREGVARALRKAWGSASPLGPIPMSSPFGDGHAAEAIVAILRDETGAPRAPEGPWQERPATS